jgi:hypothetical protein
MSHRMSGYSILELVIVTTFLAIFLLAVNPATYMKRFSGILLKMNVMEESTLLVHKLNALSTQACQPVALSSTQFQYTQDSQSLTLGMSTNGVTILNNGTNTQALLYNNLELASPTGFVFYTYGGSSTNTASSPLIVDYSVKSSLLDLSIASGSACLPKSIVLGAF